MKKLIFLTISALSINGVCSTGFHTMVTDCKDFSLVNVLPVWKYYDSGVNAYITKTPAAELPLIHLNSESASFEQDYEVTFSDQKMIVSMLRFGSEVTITVPVDQLRTGTFESEVQIGTLEDNFKEKFGEYANTAFICESTITKDKQK